LTENGHGADGQLRAQAALRDGAEQLVEAP